MAVSRLWIALPVALVLVVAASWAGAYTVQHLLINLTLENQPISLTLPRNVRAELGMTEPVDIRLNGDISTVVPFKEVLAVPLKGEYDVDVKLDADIPVDFVVVYDKPIPIDTTIALTAKTELDFGNVKKIRNLEFSTSIPWKTELPVTLNVPVKDSIRFNYHGPIKIMADEVLRLPVDTEFEPTIYVDQRVLTPVRTRVVVDAVLPQTPLDATFSHAELNVRPSTIQLLRRQP